MSLGQGPQRSDAGEVWTTDPLISSQALYHWATALPQPFHGHFALYFLHKIVPL